MDGDERHHSRIGDVVPRPRWMDVVRVKVKDNVDATSWSKDVIK